MSPHPVAEESVFAECAGELAALGPALVGAETGEIENELVACMPAPVAMGVELALRDLEARVAGRTLAEALGGGKNATKPTGGGGAVAGVGGGPVAEAL